MNNAPVESMHINSEEIISRIFYIRGKKVMLDKDLATLYEVETKRLNEQVKRNIKRFPKDFMFQLTENEWKSLRSQVATLEKDKDAQKKFDNLKSHFATSRWGGVRKLPLAFTENGVAMLSGVLTSDRAIEVNVQIMRTFTKIREMLSVHKDLQRKMDQMERKYDQQFQVVFKAIKNILLPPEKSKPIGFLKDSKSRNQTVKRMLS